MIRADVVADAMVAHDNGAADEDVIDLEAGRQPARSPGGREVEAPGTVAQARRGQEVAEQRGPGRAIEVPEQNRPSGILLIDQIWYRAQRGIALRSDAP